MRKNLFQFEILLVVVLGLEILIFTKTGTNFATQGNMFEILRLSTEIGLLALVMTPIILTGGIDLSVGSMLGLSAVLFGKMWRDLGMSPALAAICTLVLAALGGSLNALLITRLKLPPLIVTLARFPFSAASPKPSHAAWIILRTFHKITCSSAKAIC